MKPCAKCKLSKLDEDRFIFGACSSCWRDWPESTGFKLYLLMFDRKDEDYLTHCSKIWQRWLDGELN
jgi:hypothetical protein